MITLVPFHTVGREIAQNAETHWKEAIEDVANSSLKIDWEYFISLSQQGQCVASVLLVDNKMRGYSVYTIDSDPLFKDRIEATSQAFYIEPAFRRHAQSFLKESNEKLKELGVKGVNYMLGNERLGKLISRIGLKQKYTVWSIDYE